MEKYSRYYGIIAFVVIVLLAVLCCYSSLTRAIDGMVSINTKLEQKEKERSLKIDQKKIVERKLAQILTTSRTIQKKVYAPVDTDLGNDTLFFTLYSDLIEMVHSNSVKIKSMEYLYNPESDAFVKFSKDQYFVSEVSMELVSNYTNLGKLIQDIVQYPYYIRILSVEIKPYERDKKILVANMRLRLYAHTAPETPLE